MSPTLLSVGNCAIIFTISVMRLLFELCLYLVTGKTALLQSIATGNTTSGSNTSTGTTTSGSNASAETTIGNNSRSHSNISMAANSNSSGAKPKKVQFVKGVKGWGKAGQPPVEGNQEEGEEGSTVLLVPCAKRTYLGLGGLFTSLEGLEGDQERHWRMTIRGLCSVTNPCHRLISLYTEDSTSPGKPMIKSFRSSDSLFNLPSKC
ncbi:hypothetical protein QR685DRAFT_555550 [Neurospora intermedia]|uniref:Uncharacterized protein n=1 Tax=Neurospora intermedia TaxID=5142 RepID=A0ABR3D6R1_NEUIN